MGGGGTIGKGVDSRGGPIVGKARLFGIVVALAAGGVLGCDREQAPITLRMTTNMVKRTGLRDRKPRGQTIIRFAGSDLNLYGYVLADPVNAFDPTGLHLNCGALFELIAHEKLYGKYLTSKIYSGDKAIPLNANYPSIYGPVDIDWMMRVTMGGLASIPGAGRGISWASYFAGKTFWNTIRAFGDEYELEYGSLFELGNYNSWLVANEWLQNWALTLEEIFRPSVEYCNCLYDR